MNVKNSTVTIFFAVTCCMCAEQSQSKLIKVQEGRGIDIPIILVHGLSSEKEDDCRWGTLVKILTTNPKASRLPLYIWKHNSKEPIGFNGKCGNAIELKVDLDTAFGEKEIILIAHSRGGLICRSLMNGSNWGSRVLRLITIGTPHHGSPLAVPDLVALRFSRAKANAFNNAYIFDYLYNKHEQAKFPIEDIGAINLAWDNADKLVTAPIVFEYDAVISASKIFKLSRNDFNCLDSGAEDETVFYKRAQKEDFGTLDQLNKNEKYFSRIYAIGAYRSSLVRGSTRQGNQKDGSNETSTLSDLGKLNSATFVDTHEQLFLCAQVMCGIHETVNSKVNYFANDGLVPLQSALFLDTTDGDTFASVDNKLNVKIDKEKIHKKSLVRAKMFSSSDDKIEDHQDLIATQEDRYWGTILDEIEQIVKEKYVNNRVKWFDKFKETVLKKMRDEQSSVLASKIMKIAHPTGLSPKLSEVAVDGDDNKAIVSLTIVWKGGLSNATYKTQVTWHVDRVGHLKGEILPGNDTALIKISSANAQKLDEYFATFVYDLVKEK